VYRAKIVEPMYGIEQRFLDQESKVKIVYDRAAQTVANEYKRC